MKIKGIFGQDGSFDTFIPRINANLPDKKTSEGHNTIESIIIKKLILHLIKLCTKTLTLTLFENMLLIIIETSETSIKSTKINEELISGFHQS